MVSALNGGVAQLAALAYGPSVYLLVLSPLVWVFFAAAAVIGATATPMVTEGVATAHRRLRPSVMLFAFVLSGGTAAGMLLAAPLLVMLGMVALLAAGGGSWGCLALGACSLAAWLVPSLAAMAGSGAGATVVASEVNLLEAYPPHAATRPQCK